MFVRSTFAFDFEFDDAPSAVERNAVNQRNQRRINVFAADADEFFLHGFRVVNALHAQLVADTEHNCAAVGVGERDDFLTDSFGIGKF